MGTYWDISRRFVRRDRAVFRTLALVLVAAVCVQTQVRADQHWRPVPGKRYFGLWSNPGLACEYVFDTDSDPENESYRGQILLPSRGTEQPEQPARFALARNSNGSWRFEWLRNRGAPITADEIGWIRTVHGECLAGQFNYGEALRLILIWPDADAAENPFRWPEPRTIEFVDSDEGEFRLWTAEDGLASNATRSIVQTSDGYVWIGTVEGLSRFDGLAWRTFGPDSIPRLPDNNIPSLLEDRQGRLVVGTKQEGIYRYDGTAFVPCKANEQLKRRRLSKLAESPDGSLWFTLDDARTLGRLSQGDQFESWDVGELSPVWMERYGERLNSIGAIVPYDADRVFISVPGSVIGFTAAGRTVEHGLVFSRYPSHLAAAPEGGCWWYNHHLFHLAPDLSVTTSYKLPFNFEFVNIMLPARRPGTVWFTHYYPPFDLFRLSDGVLQRFPKAAEHYDCDVVDMIEDQAGNIWLATGARGVVRYRPPAVQTLTHAKDQVVSQTYYSIAAADDGTIHYASTYAFLSGGPEKWSSLSLNELFPRPPNDSFNGNLPPLYAHGALTLPHGDSAEAWYGLERTKAARHLADDGLLDPPMPLLAHRRKDAVRLFYSDDSPLGIERAHSVAHSRRNGTFLATDQGIFHLPDEASPLQNWNRANGLESFDAYCVFVDSQDRVWLGGAESGLYRLDGTERIHFSVEKEGLGSSSVLSIWEDQRGAMWIGGREGLSRIRSDGGVDVFREGAGFLRSPIQAIVQDKDGHFWFGTPNGIFGVRAGEFDEFNKGRIEELRAVRLGRAAGLHNENVYGSRFPVACRTPDGALWFSMEGGLARFDPEEVWQRYLAGPPTRILRCESGGNVYFDAEASAPQTKLGPAGPVQLPPDAGAALVIDYTGMSFIDPERTRFQYQLSGVTQGWKDNGVQRSVTFTRLAPGDYQFEVRAVAPNNLSNSTPSILTFSIAPFFYQTWMFRFGLAALVVGTGFGLHRWRLAYRERIKELEKQVELDAERSRIARDMHDELGSALARIRMRCELAREFGQEPGDVKGLTSEIGDFAYATAKSLREIIWSLNPNRASYTDLADYVQGLVEDYFEGSGVHPRVQIGQAASQALISPALKRDLILILKGIMSNVLKHAGATEFCLQLSLQQNALHLRASDDGCGFDILQHAPDSHGWQFLEDRTRSWNGKLVLHSAPAHGTRVYVQLKLSPI